MLGAAAIAEAFVEGVRESERVEVVAIASRTLARAEAFAHAHGIARALGSYEALLADDGVDAVYVPLPNALHAPWSIAAARAGKHVLCEKPLAGSEAEARGMFEAAEARGVVLLEAFPFHFQPHTREIERVLSAGEIGELRYLQASFGFTLKDAGNVRLDPALGGGALMDVGCYPASLSRLVFGRRPENVTASAVWTERGVDLTLGATLGYDGGAFAQIACSMATTVHRHALLVASAGAIETDYQNHADRKTTASLRIKRGVDWTHEYLEVPAARLNGFRLEADAFAAMIDAPLLAARRRQESLDAAATLAALLESARTGRRVDVAAA